MKLSWSWLTVPVGAGILIVAVLLWPRHAPAPTPPAVIHNDSLVATRAQATRAIDSLTAVAAHAERAAREADVARAKAQASARAAGARADSLARDSLWHAAYIVRTAQVEDLTHALAASQAANDSLTVSLGTLTWAVDSLTKRLTATEQVNAELARAAKEASTGCTVAFHIPCPSRTQAFVAGAVLGGVLLVGHR